MSSQPSTTIGVDIGDRYSHLCLLDTETGDVVEEARIATDPAAFERRFAGNVPVRVAIEAGTHSPWISRLLERLGHEVLVANARRLRLIYGEGRKTDRLDAVGEDCDLRRHGEKLAARGGKSAKKRAVVAVARKLSVLLHRLWVTGEAYDPLRNAGLPRGERLRGA